MPLNIIENLNVGKVCFYGRISSNNQLGNTSQTRQTGPDIIKRVKSILSTNPSYNNHITMESNIYYQGDENGSLSAFKGDNLTDINGQWQKMLKTINAGDLVVIEAWDRFSRMDVDTARGLMKQYLNQYNFHVIFLNNPSRIITKDNFSAGMNALVGSMESVLSNDESVNKSIRVREGMRISKEKAIETNTPLKGQTPNWITKQINPLRYDLHPLAGEILTFIYENTLLGLGTRAIARKCNEKWGNQPWNGSPFTPRIISIYQKYTWVIGKHPSFPSTNPPQYTPAITEELYYRVQSLLIRSKKSGRKSGKSSTARSLWSSIGYCKCCGSRLYCGPVYNHETTYSCKNGKFNAGCYYKPIQETVLNTAIEKLCLHSNSLCSAPPPLQNNKVEVEYIKVKNEVELLQTIFMEAPSKYGSERLNIKERELANLFTALEQCSTTSPSINVNNYKAQVEEICKEKDEEKRRLLHRQLIRNIIYKFEIDYRDNKIYLYVIGEPHPKIIEYIPHQAIILEDKRYDCKVKIKKNLVGTFWDIEREWVHKSNPDIILKLSFRDIGKKVNRIPSNDMFKRNCRHWHGYILQRYESVKEEYNNAIENKYQWNPP